MEWVALATWILLLVLALPLAAAGGRASGWLGLQSFFVIGGLTTCALLIVLDGGEWLAWTSFGLGIAAAIAVVFGAARLVSDVRPLSAVGQTTEEHAALLAGVEASLLLAVSFAMLLTAVGVSTVL